MHGAKLSQIDYAL